MSTALEPEITTYKESVPRLLSASDKFVLIHDKTIVGTFDTYGDALRCGYEKFGLKPFLVKQIEQVETVQQFTRDLNDACHT